MEELYPGFAGAFFGAFFSYLFVRGAEHFERIRQRRVKSRNAIVQLQHAINEYVGMLDEAAFILTQCKTFLGKAITSQHALVWTNWPPPVPIEKALLLDLINIDLINELFSFNQHLRKLNQSITTTGQFNDELRAAVISKTIETQNYQENLKLLLHAVSELLPFIEARRDTAIDLLAALRVLSRDEDAFFTLRLSITPRRYGPSFAKERHAALAELRREIEDGSARDRERIGKIKGSSPPADI